MIITLLIAGISILLIGLALTIFILGRRVPPGHIGIRAGFLGYRLSDTWILSIPLLTTFEKMDISVRKLVIERKGGEGLICRDNIRADIEATFYIKVNYPKVVYPAGMDQASPEGWALCNAAMKSRDRFDDVKKVAQTIGCERAADSDKLLELFEAKFSHAIKATAKLMDFSELYCDRQGFRKHIIAAIGQDLNGYVLEDVALESLEQTPLEYLDHNNTLDAEGIKKITIITAMEAEETNLRTREKDIRIKEQDVRAQEKFRELERKYEEFLANQQSRLGDELAKVFPDMETVEEIRAHIWKDHPVWGRLTTVWHSIGKLEAEVELLKSKNPPNS